MTGVPTVLGTAHAATIGQKSAQSFLQYALHEVSRSMCHQRQRLGASLWMSRPAYQCLGTKEVVGQLLHGAGFLFLFFLFLLGTRPYKETCGDKHKTRHRGCRDDVPMYREQLDRPGVSALALQPGIEKKGGGAWSGSKNNNLVRERGASIAPNNNYKYV